MRKEKWCTQSVYFTLKLDDKIIHNYSTKPYACYGPVNRQPITPDHVLTLVNFHMPETYLLSKDYITKLGKIFDVDIKFINDDEIEVKGFRSKFYCLLFCTMFRYLFENYVDSKIAVKFITAFINDKRRIDILYKFIDNFNKTGFKIISYGSGHCISNNYAVPLPLYKKKDLIEFDSKNKDHYLIHKFFTKR